MFKFGCNPWHTSFMVIIYCRVISAICATVEGSSWIVRKIVKKIASRALPMTFPIKYINRRQPPSMITKLKLSSASLACEQSWSGDRLLCHTQIPVPTGGYIWPGHVARISESMTLPGHLKKLQTLESLLLPRQSLPPCSGAGLLHSRYLVCSPPSQTWEHNVHSVHFDQSPSTENIERDHDPVKNSWLLHKSNPHGTTCSVRSQFW